MDKAWFDRWMPATGILFVILVVIGSIVAGDFPGPGDPAEEFATHYADERGRLLAAAVIIAFAYYAFIWFVAAVAGRVRDTGESRLAAAVLGGGIAVASMVLVIIGIYAALAHTVAEEVDPEVLKSVDVLTFGIGAVSLVPAAALVFAFGVASLRSGVVAPWFGMASLPAALVIILGATTWAREGFWSLDGAYSWIANIVLLVWIVVASVLLVARTPAAGAERAAAPPPPGAP